MVRNTQGRELIGLGFLLLLQKIALDCTSCVTNVLRFHNTMSDRIIAIGDVHGCAQELESLLERLSLGSKDTVVVLGDIVNRGPDSRKVVEICRSIGAVALLGNHERRLLRARNGKRWRKLDEVDLLTFKAMKTEDWAYLDGMRLFYHVPEQDVVFVHGGFLPGKPWQKQTERDVTRIQLVDGKGRALKRSEAPKGCPHWSELWKRAPFVVYGHTPRHEVSRTEWTLGLDTGCVYGGMLSAFVLPAREVVQVKSQCCYYPPPMSWRG